MPVFPEYISVGMVLFFILYGVTGVVPLLAALYLLLRRGNAFAASVTPPLQLRRWAAAFFAMSSLSHLWWLLLYFYSGIHLSAYEVAVFFIDAISLFITIAGTLLAMLQDRKRPVWPIFVAMIPLAGMGVVLMAYPTTQLLEVAGAYYLLVFVLFVVYMSFAVRQYGRWLRDNYSDLERKEVWLTQTLSLFFTLLIVLYSVVNSFSVLLYILHFIELTLFVILLWRVETLSSLTPNLTPAKAAGDNSQEADDEEPSSLLVRSGNEPMAPAVVERLLAENCVAPQLYLQHDLTLQQLAIRVGTNRSYLSRYFSLQSITYNTYINNLRINHFIRLYQEVLASRQPFTVQQLVSQSGYRSYSTFSLAFKQRMGQSVTAWMQELAMPQVEKE